MGLRFKKSVKIAPGVKVNLNKKSTSVTFGTKGYHKTYSSTGRKTTTAGIPGTGLSYSETESVHAKKKASTSNKNQNNVSTINIPKENTYSNPLSKYSPKALRTYANILYILSTILIIMCLLLLLVVPVAGVIGIAFGIFIIFIGKKYKRIAREKESEGTINYITE